VSGSLMIEAIGFLLILCVGRAGRSFYSISGVNWPEFEGFFMKSEISVTST
jgi:hypothetical protein